MALLEEDCVRPRETCKTQNMVGILEGQNMKVLVTGAAGFIGSHVAERLAQRGDTVIGLDNLNDYYAPRLKRANVAEVLSNIGEHGSFAFAQGDIRDTALLGRLFSEESLDVIVHLAAMAGVRASIRNPTLYYDVNVMGTLQLLEMAAKSNVRHFVFASTSAVYGATKRMPFVEDDLCVQPISPYAASKRAAELLGFTYHRLYGLNFTALRFFTVYGPRNRPDMLAFKIVESIYHQVEVPLYENGKLSRDWTFVNDVVEAVIAAVDRPLGYEIINIGRGHPILVADFVSLVEHMTGGKAVLKPAPKPDTDIDATFADISKARQLLGYQPSVSVEEGVKQLVEWYERRQHTLTHQ